MAEHGLSDDEVADLREAFGMYDVDGGGMLQQHVGRCLIEPE
jgi:hypothetical protein